MNSIQRINRINQAELDNNVSDAASWHRDYKDTLYIYIGNLNKKLAEKDVVIIFSQYGIPTHIKMMKTEDGLCKGWCYLKYETFDSCVLAVDNFNGITVYDQTIRVDHCWFKLREGETEEQYLIDYDAWAPRKRELEWKKQEERDLKRLQADGEKKVEHGLDDPVESTGVQSEARGSVDPTDDFRDPMDDFKDPMDDLKDPMDDFKDPMDDFKDPMEDFKDTSQPTAPATPGKSHKQPRHNEHTAEPKPKRLHKQN